MWNPFTNPCDHDFVEVETYEPHAVIPYDNPDVQTGEFEMNVQKTIDEKCTKCGKSRKQHETIRTFVYEPTRLE